ncbi:uncharacterized protein JCM15063_006258 [Sporobolomyces koalae]|uniref:uncharacterized protein n=1 Tax=Sporobolomyces koalae TaxID=500713 RepID=UPI0031724D14
MDTTLGPAFSYSTPSLPSASASSTATTSRHAANPSLSSTASIDTTSSISDRSSRTSYTSSYCSYEDDDDDEDDRSVLEDLYETLTTASSSLRESPPRLPRDSNQHLRERTRYRSSASFAPVSSRPSPRKPNATTSMDLSAFLASLPPTLDRCFCGKEAEEDSIYCSRVCAQEDALNALCGASSGAEDSDRASLLSGSSGSAASQSGESHYRRVEREEVRREKERQANLARERAVARRRAREGESISSAGSTGSKKGSLWRTKADVGAHKASSSYSSSKRAETPSLSSSVSSISSVPSPVSASFPTSTPQLVTPVILAPGDPPRPSTPSPPLEMSDIYSSYLATTPLALSSDSKLLRTPTQQYGVSSPSTPRSNYPQNPSAYNDDLEEEDDSPTGRAARMRSKQQQQQQQQAVSDVGLRMLQLCSSYPSSPSDDLLSESLDCVQLETPSLGWGHREMQERMNRKQGRNGVGAGHTKGKLSFEDVVGILGA